MRISRIEEFSVRCCERAIIRPEASEVAVAYSGLRAM
jgi:hypothetical protein